jgi:hypothetical protein
MLTDHLSMKLSQIVSVETLFEAYRRWILDARPFDNVETELESISLTAAVEKRLFEGDPTDEIGRFGRFADAFDVSTAMPLVVYLATEADLGDRLSDGLALLESYILRRDICGHTTKNYNRFFVGIIDRLREAEGDKIAALAVYLSTRQSDIDRWPDDAEWQIAWMSRDQYKPARQPRLRYLFEGIERRKRTTLSEDIEIKSALSIEHIMPQSWRINWPIAGFDHLEDDLSVELLSAQMRRDQFVNTLGNLTLLTTPLNSKVSNGPFSEKMPAVRAHSSLALNRELSDYDRWDEDSVAARSASLFDVARKVWRAPDQAAASPA